MEKMTLEEVLHDLNAFVDKVNANGAVIVVKTKELIYIEAANIEDSDKDRVPTDEELKRISDRIMKENHEAYKELAK